MVLLKQAHGGNKTKAIVVDDQYTRLENFFGSAVLAVLRLKRALILLAWALWKRILIYTANRAN